MSLFVLFKNEESPPSFKMASTGIDMRKYADVVNGKGATKPVITTQAGQYIFPPLFVLKYSYVYLLTSDPFLLFSPPPKFIEGHS